MQMRVVSVKTAIAALSFVAMASSLVWISSKSDRETGLIELPDAIVQKLASGQVVNSENDFFAEASNVCIFANNSAEALIAKRGCDPTSSPFLALINSSECKMFALSKIPARVLLSEGSFECEPTTKCFNVRVAYFHDADRSNVLMIEKC